MPRRPQQDFLVLNADNARAAAGRRPLGRHRSTGFPIEHPVEQGAWLEDGFVVYRAAKDAADGEGDAAERNPAQGRAQRGECAGRGGAPPAWPASRPRRFAAPSRAFRPSSIAWSSWPRVNGVEFYNDSKATNVDATAKAIAAFVGGIHLILGGKDKDSDYTQLADLLRERVSAVYTIGSAAAKIESHLRGVVSIHSCETLDKAVARRRRRRAPRRGGAARPGLLQLRPV